MSETLAAYRYAKAVMDLAVESKQADALEKDMRQVREGIAGSDDLRDLLGNPVVNTAEKLKALKAVFAGAKPMTQKLFDVLGENKRIGLLDTIAHQFILLYEKMQGQDIALVTTAVPLSAAQEKSILSQLKKITGKETSLQNEVDPELIGGFVLRVGDLEYNASVAGKLDHLKRELIKR